MTKASKIFATNLVLNNLRISIGFDAEAIAAFVDTWAADCGAAACAYCWVKTQESKDKLIPKWIIQANLRQVLQSLMQE